MEQLLTALLEAAKKDRKGLTYLKETAVRCQQFELASELRQLEAALYPETEYIKLEKDKADKLSNVLRVCLNQEIPVSLAWHIKEIVTAFNEKGMQLTIDEATEITFKRIEIFGE